VKDAANLPLALRACSYRLFMKPLLLFKAKFAGITLILIYRHLLHLG